MKETGFLDCALRKDIVHNIESKEEKIRIVSQQCVGYSISVIQSDFDAYICRHLRQLIEGHSLGA